MFTWPIASVSAKRTSIVDPVSEVARQVARIVGGLDASRGSACRRSVCRLDDERAGHPGLGVTGHGADDPVRAGLVDREADLRVWPGRAPASTLASPSASQSWKTGSSLRNDSTTVRPASTRTSAGVNAVSRAVTVDCVAPAVDPAVGGHDTARQPERRQRDRAEEPRLAQPAERAGPADAMGRLAAARRTTRSRSALATTVTDDSAIAPAASAGERAMPNGGISTPIATGMRTML